MNDLGTLTRPRIHPAKAGRLRLPELLDIEGQVPPPRRGWQGYLAALRSEGAGAVVAEVPGHVIGFALYKTVPVSAPAHPSPLARLRRWCKRWGRAACPAPSSLRLLRIGVHPDWRRQGIGRALLREIHQMVTPGGGRVRATVPESNLTAQLFLKDAGYKAVRILRSHYGGEDGYLMEMLC